VVTGFANRATTRRHYFNSGPKSFIV